MPPTSYPTIKIRTQISCYLASLPSHYQEKNSSWRNYHPTYYLLPTTYYYPTTYSTAALQPTPSSYSDCPASSHITVKTS